MKGSPIKAVVNGKNVSVPVFFFGFAGALSVGFNSFDPSLLFRRSIADPSREAIRSVTHLGLARGVKCLTGSPIRTERKQAGRPGLLPSGSFLGHHSLNPGACICQTASPLRPTPIFRSPENLQCRSVFIQCNNNCGWPRIGRAASNLLLTHGTVESLQNFGS